jgi:hypothetical protein
VEEELLACINRSSWCADYFADGALGSWGGGPEDDIAIIYLLAVPILLHGFVTAKYGLKLATRSALILFLLVATLCIARHFEISGRSGYNDWHANRSLLSLAWSIPWFLGGLSFTLIRKTVSPIIEESEQAVHGNTH